MEREMYTPAKEIKEERQVQLSEDENNSKQLSGKIDVSLGATASAEDKTHSPNPVCPPNLPIDKIPSYSSEKGAGASIQTPREDLLTGEVQSFRDPNSIARGSSIGVTYSNSKPTGELNHHIREVYKHDGYLSAHTPMNVPRYGVHLPIPLYEDINSIKTPMDSEAEYNRLNIHKEGVSPTSESAPLSSEKKTRRTPFMGPPMSSFDSNTITGHADSGLLPPRNTSEGLESRKYPLTSLQSNQHYKFSRRTLASVLLPPAPEERVARRLLQSPIPEFTEGSTARSDALASRPYHRRALVSPSLNDQKGLSETMPPRFPSQGYGTHRTKLPPSPPPLPESRYSEDQRPDISNAAPSQYADPWEQHSYTSSCMREDHHALQSFFSKRWEEQKRKYSTHNTSQNLPQYNVADTSAAPMKDSRTNASIELWKSVMNRSGTWSSRTQRPETETPTFLPANTISNRFTSKPSHNPKLQAPYDSNENATVGRTAEFTSTVWASHAQHKPRSRTIELDAPDESLGGGASSFFSTTNNPGSKQGQERSAASHVWASTDEKRIGSNDGVQSKPQRPCQSYVDEDMHTAPKERVNAPLSKHGLRKSGEGEGDDVSLRSQTDINRMLDLNSVAEEVGSAHVDKNSTSLQGQLQEGQTKAEALARHLIRAIQDRKILQENVEELECLVEECNFEIERLHKLIEEKDSDVVDTQALSATLHVKEREVALCEDEIKRLTSIVERHMERLGTRKDGVISRPPKGNVWKQGMELDMIVTEVSVARTAQREAEDRAELLASELEAAVDRIRALDKRLVEMEHVAATHRLQVMQSRLVFESEDSRFATSDRADDSTIPLPTSEETAQWPMTARRVLNRLASYAEGLMVQNSESSRHASLQIQNMEQSCERFRRTLQTKTNELRQLQDECLSLRKEKEMLRLCGTQWYGQLQEVKEGAQLISELVHISKDNAEEAVLSCITAEAQQDVLSKIDAPGTVVTSQASHSAISTCKEFAQQVVKDMHAVSRFLSALREMNISENNGYQILQNLADGSAPAENLFLEEGTAPNSQNTLGINKGNTVSLIKQKKDFVVRTVEQMLEGGFSTTSQAIDSEPHTLGYTAESGKPSKRVWENDARHNHRGSMGAMPLDKVALYSYKNGEYDDEITEADMLEETDSPNLGKKTRRGSELETVTTNPTMPWTSKGIWADSDAKKVDQSVSNGLQKMQTSGLLLPPRNGNVASLSAAHLQPKSLSYAPQGEDEENPDRSSRSRPPHSSSNSVWRLSGTDELRHSVKVSDDTAILPSEYVRDSLKRGNIRLTENPITTDNTIHHAGSAIPSSTSQRMGQVKEAFDEPNVQLGNDKRVVEKAAKSSILAATPKSADIVDTTKDDESPILQRMDNAFLSIDPTEAKKHQVYHKQDDSTPMRMTNEKDSIDSPTIKFPNTITGYDKVGINSSVWKEELEQDTPSNPPRRAVVPMLPHETSTSSSPSTNVFRITHSDDESALYDMPQLMQPKERSATMPPQSFGIEASSKHAQVDNLTGVHEAVPRNIEVAPQRVEEAGVHTSLTGSAMNTIKSSRSAPVSIEEDRTESRVMTSVPFSATVTQHPITSAVSSTSPGNHDINIQGSQQFSNSEKQSQSSGLRPFDNDDDDENMPSLSFFSTNEGMGQPQPVQVAAQPLGIVQPENDVFVKEKPIIGEDLQQSTMSPSELEKVSASLILSRSGVFDLTSSVDEIDKPSEKGPIKALHRVQADHQLGKPLALSSDGAKFPRQGPVSDAMNRPALPRLQPSFSTAASSLSASNPPQAPSQSSASVMNTEKSMLPRRPAAAAAEPQPALRLRSESSVFTRSSEGEDEGGGDAQRPTATPSEVEAMGGPRSGPDRGPSEDRSPPLPAPSEPRVIAPSEATKAKQEGGDREVAVVAMSPNSGEREMSREIYPRTPLRPRTRPNETTLPPSLRPGDTVENSRKEGECGDEDVAALAVVPVTKTDDIAATTEVDEMQKVGLESSKDTKSDGEDHIAVMGSNAERRAAVSRILEKIKNRKADAVRTSQNTA